MSDEILKGNFKIQNKIKDEKISINKKESNKRVLRRISAENGVGRLRGSQSESFP